MSDEKIILFISDDAAEARLCEMILQHARHDRVMLVPCRSDALRTALTDSCPHVIFLAHGYGAMGDLLSLYQCIRSHATGTNIPVVFWRTDMFAARVHEAITLGISGYIPVVCQPDDIIAARDAALAGIHHFPLVNYGQYRKRR